MKIGDKIIKEILITANNDEMLGSITDENIIEEDSIKIVCVPYES